MILDDSVKIEEYYKIVPANTIDITKTVYIYVNGLLLDSDDGDISISENEILLDFDLEDDDIVLLMYSIK